MRRPLAALLVPLAIAVTTAGCGGDDEPPDAFCDAAGALDDRIADLDEALEEGDREPARILDDMEDELGRLAEEAPGAEAEDLEDMAASVRRLADAIRDVDLDEPGALEGIGDEIAEIDDELEASSERVGEELERRCGIDIGDAEE